MSTRVAPKPYKAPIAIPPGFTIQELLDDRGMRQEDLAHRMGRPVQMVNEIIKAKKAITAETAGQLGTVLGMTQQYWLNREANYQAAKERLEYEKTVANDVKRLNEFPYTELVQRGLVPDVNGRSNEGKRQRVHHLHRFLRVASFTALDTYIEKNYGLAARLAKTTALSNAKLAVWLRLGEKQTEEEQWPFVTFKKRVLESALPALRTLTREQYLNVVKRQLREIGKATGVVFLFVQEFKGFPAKGMTVWMNKRPHIMLTLHGKRWDMIWFTLFHEIGHILLHEQKIFIEGSNFTQNDLLEEEADTFARDALIPSVEYHQFIKGSITPSSTVYFAEHVHIDPSIVVGRLMHEERVDYNDPAYRQYLRWAEWER